MPKFIIRIKRENSLCSNESTASKLSGNDNKIECKVGACFSKKPLNYCAVETSMRLCGNDLNESYSSCILWISARV